MLAVVAPEVWEVQHLMGLPGGVRMPVRMTVLRLPAGRLLLHSPVPLTDEVGGAIGALGTVTWVVAPSRLHHLFVAPCLARWPEAMLYGASALATKRPDLPWRGELASDEHPFGDEVRVTPVDGAPAMAEVAFLHQPSGSLLVSDLLFNVTAPANRRTGALLYLMGTHGRLAMSRAFRFLTRDRRALKASVERILAWPFHRILPGHGAVFDEPAARERARTALAWAMR